MAEGKRREREERIIIDVKGNTYKCHTLFYRCFSKNTHKAHADKGSSVQ